MTNPITPPSRDECDQFFTLRDATPLLPQDAAAAWLLRDPKFIACAREWGEWRMFDGDESEVLGRVDAALARQAADGAAQ